MCGRYRIKDTDELTKHLRETFGIPDWVPDQPRFNIAPSQDVPAIVMDDDGNVLPVVMRWGYVPYWDRSEKPKLAPINARSEEAFDKGMFKLSIQKRRCLIPADGFYEWKRLPDGKTKFPFDIHLKGNRPFFFAGIYEKPTSIETPAGEKLRPATNLLFTTRPNELMVSIHDRMPVIVDGDQARRWIDRGELSKEQFLAMTEPHSAGDMEAVEISSLVNSPRNDGPEILTPATALRNEPQPPSAKQGELF